MSQIHARGSLMIKGGRTSVKFMQEGV